MTASAAAFNATWLSVVAGSLPVFLWVKDSVVALCRVQGTSMEPTLYQGDIVLVRKCDAGSWTNLIFYNLFSRDNDKDETDRARLHRHDEMGGTGLLSVLLQHPPTALSGNVVVYKNPETAFPFELCIKRAIGVSGMYVKEIHNNYNKRLLLQPYTLYVEGDNLKKSRDSRHYGPISKGLLVGVAEAVVWPPNRWRRLAREPQTDSNGKCRASWQFLD
jgi:signal peptidase I